MARDIHEKYKRPDRVHKVRYFSRNDRTRATLYAVEQVPHGIGSLEYRYEIPEGSTWEVDKVQVTQTTLVQIDGGRVLLFYPNEEEAYSTRIDDVQGLTARRSIDVYALLPPKTGDGGGSRRVSSFMAEARVYDTEDHIHIEERRQARAEQNRKGEDGKL